MGAAEFLLTVVLGFLFWKKKLHRRFPSMGTYLGLRMIAEPVLLMLFCGDRIVRSPAWMICYFYLSWAVYIASAVLLFMVSIEVFRSALQAFQGLTKFGIVIFRWAVLASIIVSLSTFSYSHRGILIIPDLAYGLMRSVSVIELCLLGFLCLMMNALGLSVRDVGFGIALGFGLMSANDFCHSLLVSRSTSLAGPGQFVYESLILASLGVWLAYCAAPEPAPRPVMVSVNSAIYRWNEIASALGHTGTQVVVPQSASRTFLTDVDSVVDRVLAKNLKDRESET